jgi:hypothetical protein
MLNFILEPITGVELSKKVFTSRTRMVGTATTSYDTDPNWYTESGTTDHITGELKKLTMHDHYTGNDQIQVANGAGMEISHIGKSIVPTPSRNLVLNNVLHVPATRKNLICVHWFTLDNNTFIEFHPYFFLIKDQNMRKVLLRGPCKGGLYPLPSVKQLLSIIKLSVD